MGKKKFFLSDIHGAPFLEEKFDSQKFSFGEWVIQFFRGITDKKFILEMARELIENNGISFGVHGGDLIESSCTEQGVRQRRDREALISSTNCLFGKLGFLPLFCAGNHELGYSELPLITDPKAGISKRSIRNFLDATKRDSLYLSTVHENVRFILLPYLFMEKKAVDFNIEELKRELLERFKRDLEKGEDVILVLHDPDGMCHQPLLDLMLKHKKKIKLVFCGHYHAQEVVTAFNLLVKMYNSFFFAWITGVATFALANAFDLGIATRIFHYFRSRRKLPELLKLFDVKIIPALEGTLGFGAGFLLVDLEDFTVKKYP